MKRTFLRFTSLALAPGLLQSGEAPKSCAGTISVLDHLKSICDQLIVSGIHHRVPN